jgi:hypothetical protein
VKFNEKGDALGRYNIMYNGDYSIYSIPLHVFFREGMTSFLLEIWPISIPTIFTREFISQIFVLLAFDTNPTTRVSCLAYVLPFVIFTRSTTLNI